MSERPTCASCPFYEATIAASPEAASHAARHGGDERGKCRFLPQLERKHPGEWCAQHPGVRRWVIDENLPAARTAAIGGP